MSQDSGNKYHTFYSQRTHCCFSLLHFLVYPCVAVQYSVQTTEVRDSIDGHNFNFFIKGSMGEILGKPEQD